MYIYVYIYIHICMCMYIYVSAGDTYVWKTGKRERNMKFEDETGGREQVRKRPQLCCLRGWLQSLRSVCPSKMTGASPLALDSPLLFQLGTCKSVSMRWWMYAYAKKRISVYKPYFPPFFSSTGLVYSQKESPGLEIIPKPSLVFPQDGHDQTRTYTAHSREDETRNARRNANRNLR